MKERKLYSLTGKLIVFLLLIVFAASALFGGIQTLMLSSVGLTPNAAAKKYAFEETTACGTLVQRQLHNVMSYYNDMSKFGTNGRYDGTKEIDYRAFATDGEGSGGISTTYTIDQLVKMYDDGSSADLNEVAAYTADNYATNDAGIDKEAYLAYEDGTDVSQETEETDVAALTEEVSAADAETFDSFSPDGEVYFPSDNAVKSLKEKKIDPADVSSQFLYLYDQGMSLETQKTKAGTYLYEYAAANLKKVSIRDLYMTLSGVTEEVAAFKNQESGISVDADDANLWYCLEDKEGNIYTNVDSWKNGYTTAIAQKSPYPFAFAVDRTGGADKVRSYATRKNSPAVEAARSYLLNNQIADNYQKIFVALDPDLAASDYFSQYSEIYSQWLPKMQLLLLMIAVGGIGTLVCLVLFTLQAGRNGKNKEIRLYFFDQWYTEIAAAAAILIVMGAVGIVAVCIELSYGGVHYIQNFDGNYIYSGSYGNEADTWRSLVAASGILAGFLITLIPYCSLVRRIKARNVWKQSFLYCVGHRIVSAGRTFYEGRQESERTILMFCVFCGVQIILCCGFGMFGVFLTLVMDAAVLLLLLREASGRKQIEHGLKEIAAGDLDYKIDLTELQGEDNLQLAGIVNSLGEGMKAAVQEQMKSERLKADLITNVSHDIKTPLTSIINYVDLLKRENIENEKAKDYIRVLDEKSQRLKQLTEDLVEASKISSGNIKLEFMNLNLNELVQQVNGEFAERFEGRNLDLICILQPEPLLIRADSRRIWRVLENLYVNVCKYSMPGTRVYITVTELRTEAFTADSSANSRKAMSSYTDGNPAGIFGENGLKKYFGKKRLHRNRAENNTDLQDSQRYDTENDTADAVGYSALPGRVSIAVKNISRERLNVATDELMERFVRGDSARTTEGSGLGLNIARSLTELQGGRFGLSIDGDLFKAEIILRSE